MSNEIKSIKKATMINAVSKYTNVVTNLLFTAILARLLSPNDYGIVAVTTVFTNFFIILVDMGVGTGIIQNKELTKKEINSIFGLTIYIGLAFCFIFCIFGYPASVFYDNSEYISIFCVLSISLLFNAFNMVPNALLMKNKQFGIVAKRNIIVPIITNIIAIIFAYFGFGYYSLLIQSVSAAIITFIWNYYTVSNKFDLNLFLKIDMTGFNKIRNYSGYQFVFSIINYFSRNLDNLLISSFLGETVLGYYDKAYRLTLYPLSMLTSVITPSLHPILSDYQNDRVYIYTQYIKILKLLSIIGIFIVPFCFGAGREIICIMFGSKWLYAVPCFQLLSLSIWSQMLTSSTGAIFQSTNNTKLMVKSAIINTLITVVAIVGGLSTGKIENMALCVSLAYIVNYGITFSILMKYIFKMSLLKLNKEFILDFLFMIISIIGMYIFNSHVEINNIFISIIIKFFLILIPYILYLLLSKKYKMVIGLLK